MFLGEQKQRYCKISPAGMGAPPMKKLELVRLGLVLGDTHMIKSSVSSALLRVLIGGGGLRYVVTGGVR